MRTEFVLEGQGAGQLKVLLLDSGTILRGGQRQVFYLARRLAQTPGFEPLVVIPAKAPLRGMLEEAGIPYTPLPSANYYNPLNIFSFLRIVATEQPDIVHTNDARSATLAALASKWRGKFKLVHSRRVSYPLKPRSRRKYLTGDALVAVSREIQDVLIQGGVPEDMTHTIHSGIDTTLYSTEKYPNVKLSIGGVGALSTQKGFAVLIEALALLRQSDSLPDWQCLIVGDGPQLQELKGKARELGLAEATRFLGYRESREVLPEIDILTVPSVDGEGSNAVIKEGWASATPVITSDLPSNLELVTDGHDGLVFRNKDAEALADRIKTLLRDKRVRDALVKNGTETVTRFSDTAMAEQYMELYRSLLSS